MNRADRERAADNARIRNLAPRDVVVRVTSIDAQSVHIEAVDPAADFRGQFGHGWLRKRLAYAQTVRVGDCLVVSLDAGQIVCIKRTNHIPIDELAKLAADVDSQFPKLVVVGEFTDRNGDRIQIIEAAGTPNDRETPVD